MNIQITTTKVDNTSELQDYVNKKISSLKKFIKNDDNCLCEVDLKKQHKHKQSKDMYYAEMNLSTEGKMFRATSEANSMFAAIDEAKEDLKRELRKANDKNRALFRKGKSKVKDILRGLSS